MPTGIVLKALVLPVGTLTTFDRVIMDGTHYAKEKRIYDHYCVTTLSRMRWYGIKEAVYKNTTVTLVYGNDPILKFSRKINEGSDKLYLLDVPGTTAAYRYAFDAVAYVQDGQPFALPFKKVNSYTKKDETLIRLLEQLIADGHFEALEYSYEYLLQYDREFIVPYIEAYADGSSEVLDSEENSHIRPAYMQDFARKIQYGEGSFGLR